MHSHDSTTATTTYFNFDKQIVRLCHTDTLRMVYCVLLFCLFTKIATIAGALTPVLNSVFSATSTGPPGNWLEAGTVQVDDSIWMTVHGQQTFTKPQILTSLVKDGGGTYSEGFAFSVRIRNKQWTPGVSGVSFDVRVIFVY